MIIITIDGLNWLHAKEIFKDTFPEQSMRMIKTDVRRYTMKGVNGTPIGLTCLWSGERIKNLHPNFFIDFGKDGFNDQYKWLDKNNNPLDLIWKYFKQPKYYEKVVGDSPYYGKQYWNHYHSLKEFNVKFAPCEELSIFSEVAKNDWDLFWIHTSIVKTGVLSIGPYEMGRHPAIIPYDEIRKDKQFKKEVFLIGVKRYREVCKYLLNIRPDEIIVISSDHGTWTDIPYSDDQIDEIPVIVNRNIDLSNVNYQWDIKMLLLELQKKYGQTQV